MSSTGKDNYIHERAQHIYYCGAGSVSNQYVEEVLRKLNEELGGYWGVLVSNDKITWLEKIED